MKKSRNILLMCALTLAVTPALAAPKHPSAGDETPKDISLEETSEEASHDQEPSLISQRLARLEEHTAQLRESRLKRRSYFNIVLAGIPTSMAIHFFESIHKEAAGGRLSPASVQAALDKMKANPLSYLQNAMIFTLKMCLLRYKNFIL